MKKRLLYIFLLLPMLLAAQGWTITPPAPKAGETVKVEFDLSKSKLHHIERVDINGLEYTNDKVRAIEIASYRSGDKLTGIFTLGPDTKSVVLNLENEADNEQADNNGGEGYFITLNDASGKQLPESMAAQAVLYRDWGAVYNLKRTASKALDMQTQAFAAQPDLKKKYWSNYISYLTAAKKGEDGKTEAMALLSEMEQVPGTSEQDLITVSRTYERLGQPEKSKAVKDKIRAAWPKGTLARQEKRKSIEMEPDLAKVEEMITAYTNQYPPQSDEDNKVVEQLRSDLANKYGDQQNWEKFRSIAAQLSAPERAGLYNNFAWELAEKGASLDEAVSMAASAVEISRRELINPSTPKAPYLSVKAWAQQRRQILGMQADTYAYVLDKKGDAKSAADLQAEVMTITKGEDPEMNERYTAYLERAASPQLRYQLEGFLLKGKATAKMQEQFKRLYMAEDRSATGADAYLNKLESVAKAEKLKSMLEKMTNDPAPGFSLKNLKGETVSLEGLRGKIVVIDFWATWCGPCKASFPGMAKAVEHYKNDPSVSFVFVDSWEKGDNKLKNAEDFITGKGYPFNVLLDNDDKVIGAFGVSGIPTKYVLDRNGKIRFKTVGFEGSDDGLMEEIKIMVEAVRSQP